MSVVIIGGNERMIRQYKDLCDEYNCDAKVFCKIRAGLKNKVGNPNLVILFTNTTSHRLVRCALSEIKGTDATIARCHSSSLSALKNILEEHVA